MVGHRRSRAGFLEHRLGGGVLVALVVLSSVVSATTRAAGGEDGGAGVVLFATDAAPGIGPGSHSPGPDVVRSRLVQVDTSAVAELLVDGDPASGEDQGDGRWLLTPRPVTLELFDGQRIDLDAISAVAGYPSSGDADGNETSPSAPTIEWQGRVGSDTNMQLSVSLVLTPLSEGGYAVRGTIDDGGRWVTVTPADGAFHVLEELDPEYPYPADQVIVAPPSDGDDVGTTFPLVTDDGDVEDGDVGILVHTTTTTVDVLVASASGVTVSPSTLVAGVNQAFNASASMPMQLNLARSRSVAYPQTADMSLDLDRLRTGYGALGVLHTERTTYRADLVVLVVPNSTPSACGIAYIPTSQGSPTLAFAVVAQPCVSGGTFVHEVGHNLGAHHNPENASGGCLPFPYSCGHRVASVARTVMAYEYSGCSCPRQLRFSTPLANFAGSTVKSGIANQRDNRRSLLNLARFVAGYRPGDPVGTVTNAERELTTFRVWGWTLDPNTVSPIQVQVFLNGTLRTTVTADTYRSDVLTHYPAWGAYHGYDVTVSVIGLETLPSQSWNVCATALNAPGTPGVNRQLGCRTL